MKVITHMYDEKVKVRNKNDRVRVQLVCPDTPEDKRTKSEFLEETDINRIMAKYKKTKQLPDSIRLEAAKYGDFSQVPDFIEMQDKIIAANNLFAALPAAVRRQFDNDAGEFIRAAETPEGRELMVKLGLGAPKSPLDDAKGGGKGEVSQPNSQSPHNSKGEPNEAKKASKNSE